MALDQRVLEIVIRAKNEASKGIKGALSSLGGLGPAAAIGATVAAVTAVGAELNHAADAAAAYGGQVVTIQRLTGASAEESSKWAAILGRFGVEGKSVGLVVKSLDTAIVGHNKALNAAGIATQDVNGKNRSATAVLGDLAQYYSTATDKTGATALAAKVLGRGYMALLPVLAKGKAGIDELTVSAQKNGLILNQDQVTAAKNFAKATKDAKDAQHGLEVQIGLTVLPIKTQLFVWLGKVVQWVTQNKGVIGAFFTDAYRVIKPIIALDVAELKVLWTALKSIWTGAKQLWAIVGPVFRAVAAIVGTALKGAIDNMRAAWAKIEPQIKPLMPLLTFLGKVVLGIIIVAIVAVVAVILGLIIAFAKIVQGVTWVIAKMIEWRTNMRATVKGAIDGIIGFLKALPGRALSAIKALPGLVGGFFSGVWKGIKTTVSKAIDGIVGFFAALPGRIVDAIKDLANWVAKPVDDALAKLNKLNPFAKHSPSLVDNVVAGAAVIARSYASLGGMKIGAPQIGGLSMPGVAFAGAGGRASGGGNLNARLVAVLERLERDGVSTNLDGRLVSRGLGLVTTHAGRSGVA